MALLYLGPANIDRIARPTRREFVSDSADNQMTQVQLPIDRAQRGHAPVNLHWQSNDVADHSGNRRGGR